MKRLFTALIFTLMSVALYAVPALKGIWQTITLTDGQQVEAELCGDEFMAFWQTADGQRFALDEATGRYAVADIDAMTARAAVWRNAAQKPVAKRLKSKNRVTLGTPVTEFQGTKKGLVILVQFSDLSFKDGHTLDLYKQIINGDDYSDDETGFVGSVKDYFKAQSYGQFEIDFDVAGPVTMSHGYAYYGADTNGATVNPEGIAEMIKAACEAVDDSINFADYDWSGDGEADLVFFVYAGEGQNNGASSNTIWPHMSTYSSMSSGKTLTLDNTKIDTYACSCEVGKYNDIDGIGTICHEFSHCFGLPDMYDLNGSNYAMGNWDVLCYGNYNGNTYGDGLIPAGYTSYERWFAGWLEPVELVNDTTVSGMKPLVDEGEAYIIYNDKHKNEYYLLENRNNKESWDAGLAGKGMLILHVNYDQSSWANNSVNTGSERYTVFAANNRYSTTYESGHPYPYGNKTELTNTSTPAATLANANVDGTYYMNKPITDIARNSDDGTVSFTFANENGNEDENNDDTSDGIANISAATTAGDTRVFSIDGRCIGSDINAVSRKGIYISGGRKIVK
ncbi:MAG: M6 family metalloprotease domain-containing protein [Prevotella sp.]|nr:M6 family metalloprotease domain-containing protein [Prevotella sp.]